MKYGITGPEQVNRVQEQMVAAAVERQLRPAVRRDLRIEFWSGCAYGVDTIGVDAAIRAGVRRIGLTIPTGQRYNTALAGLAGARHWIVVQSPQGKTASETYMLRNDITVARIDILLAFPMSAEEEVRSGTWATIRRARRAGKTLLVQPLDGTAPWTENVR